jgi:hypothetical protein
MPEDTRDMAGFLREMEESLGMPEGSLAKLELGGPGEAIEEKRLLQTTSDEDNSS